MNKINKLINISIIFVATLSLMSVLNVSGQELVRAKVGMEILKGDEARPAKSRDRIKLGNQLRVLVVPEKESYVYVINSDRNNAFLLNKDQIGQRFPGKSLQVFPSLETHYKPDGKGSLESFTIIFSLTEINEITTLFATGTAPHDAWNTLEDKLTKKSKIVLDEKVDKPFSIAGTVRKGLDSESLKVFSGNELLVKRYQFQVKK
jgi:hypothetical protein